jgi:hypothetical protein
MPTPEPQPTITATVEPVEAHAAMRLVHPWHEPPPRSNPRIRSIVRTYDSMFDADDPAHRLDEFHFRIELGKLRNATADRASVALVGDHPLLVLNWEAPLRQITLASPVLPDVTVQDCLRVCAIVREVWPEVRFGFYDLLRWFGADTIARAASYNAVTPIVIASDIIVPSCWLHPIGQIGPAEIERLVSFILGRSCRPVWPVVSSLLLEPDGAPSPWKPVLETYNLLGALPIAGLIPFESSAELIRGGEVNPGSEHFYPRWPRFVRQWLADARYRSSYAACEEALQ